MEEDGFIAVLLQIGAKVTEQELRTMKRTLAGHIGIPLLTNL